MDILTSIPNSKHPFATEIRTHGNQREFNNDANKNSKFVTTNNKSKTATDNKPKHEYTKILLEIVQQQADSYNARFQSGDKEDINKMLCNLENCHAHSLHRQHYEKVNQFGIVYAKILNSLVVKHEQLNKKEQVLREQLRITKLAKNPNKKFVLKYIKQDNENAMIKSINNYEEEIAQLSWTCDQQKHVLDRMRVSEM